MNFSKEEIQKEIEENEKLTRSKAMRKFCMQCVGVDEGSPRVSCQNPSCPMFKWMPYRKKFDEEFAEDYPELAKGLNESLYKKLTKKSK